MIHISCLFTFIHIHWMLVIIIYCDTTCCINMLSVNMCDVSMLLSFVSFIIVLMFFIRYSWSLFLLIDLFICILLRFVGLWCLLVQFYALMLHLRFFLSTIEHVLAFQIRPPLLPVIPYSNLRIRTIMKNYLDLLISIHVPCFWTNICLYAFPYLG